MLVTWFVNKGRPILSSNWWGERKKASTTKAWTRTLQSSATDPSSPAVTITLFCLQVTAVTQLAHCRYIKWGRVSGHWWSQCIGGWNSTIERRSRVWTSVVADFYLSSHQLELWIGQPLTTTQYKQYTIQYNAYNSIRKIQYHYTYVYNTIQ